MTNHEGVSDNESYGQYSSEDTELNLTMDYPGGWRYSEHRGAYGIYAQVQFSGELENNIAPSFIVKVERASKVEFQPLTTEGLADDLVKKRMLFEDSNVESRVETKLLGLPAIDLIMTYKQPVRLHSTEFKLIIFKERVIIVQKDDRFYTLRYVNPQQAYEDFEPAPLDRSRCWPRRVFSRPRSRSTDMLWLPSSPLTSLAGYRRSFYGPASHGVNLVDTSAAAIRPRL